MHGERTHAGTRQQGGEVALLPRAWELSTDARVLSATPTLEAEMGRGLLLWLIGIPLPIILLIWLFGGLS